MLNYSVAINRLTSTIFTILLCISICATALPASSGKNDVAEKQTSGPQNDDEKMTDRTPLSLEDCLKLSRKNHPAIIAAKHKLHALKKQLDEARWKPFFNIGMKTLLAPMSRMEGNAIYSPQGEFDISKDMGIWIRIELNAGFPIFTFGKIKSYWRMAEEGVKVGKMELQKQINEIEYEVRRAYFTVEFARQMISLLSEGKDYLDEAKKRIKQDLDEERGEATLSDLLKVKAYLAQVEAQIIQLKSLEKTALTGLEFLTGIRGADIPSNIIKMERGQLRSLPYYINEAMKNRPEFFMLESAIKVGKANIKLQRSHFLPDFVLVGNYTFAYANKVENQKTPFARDPYNTNSGGVALIVSYPFDFLPGYYKLDQAKARLYELKAQKKAALGGIMVEIEKIYNEASSLHERIKVLKKGKKSAKGWIVATHQSYTAGLCELKDFTDSLTTYFTISAEYYKTIYDYNISLSSLRKAVGITKIF